MALQLENCRFSNHEMTPQPPIIVPIISPFVEYNLGTLINRQKNKLALFDESIVALEGRIRIHLTQKIPNVFELSDFFTVQIRSTLILKDCAKIKQLNQLCLNLKDSL